MNLRGAKSRHVDLVLLFSELHCVSALQVRPPAQIHLTEQFVICGFLYEVVDVSLYRQRQTQHFVPALYHSQQTLLDVTYVGLGLAEGDRSRLQNKFVALIVDAS